MEDAVHAKGCQDNTSAMVIQFEHPSQQRRPAVRIGEAAGGTNEGSSAA